jgi:hypothetical protein
VEAKSLKTRAKGLSDYYSSEQQPRQPDRGPVCKIKGLLSQHICYRKEELKAALCFNTRVKGSPPKKKHLR